MLTLERERERVPVNDISSCLLMLFQNVYFPVNFDVDEMCPLCSTICLCRCILFFAGVLWEHVPPSYNEEHTLKKYKQYILKRWFLGRELVCFNF